MLVGEMLIGNKGGGANAVKSYENLDVSPSKKWRLAGFTLIGGPIILSFYAIVLGWVFYYLFMVSFNLPEYSLYKWICASNTWFAFCYGNYSVGYFTWCEKRH